MQNCWSNGSLAVDWSGPEGPNGQRRGNSERSSLWDVISDNPDNLSPQELERTGERGQGWPASGVSIGHIEQDQDDLILCVFQGGQTLGAAYYDSDTSILHLMNDVADPEPDHKALIGLLATLEPAHLVVCHRQGPSFTSIVRRITAGTEDVEDDDGESGHQLHAEIEPLKNIKLHILAGKEFSASTCLRRLTGQRLPCEAAEATSTDHRVLISSLIDFASPCTIRAAGALLRFLDKFQIGGESNGLGFPIFTINQFKLESVLAVNETTLEALQVFNSVWQVSSTRAGSWNQRREGVSLFNLISRHCSSMMGSKRLRQLFRCPLRDEAAIRERQEAISYLAQPDQLDLVKALQDCIKNVKDVSRTLKKLGANQASVKDWKGLQRSLFHMLLLCQLCSRTTARLLLSQEWSASLGHGAAGSAGNPSQAYPRVLAVLGEIATPMLNSVLHQINRIFDEGESSARNRFVVKPGVDESLDEKRRLHNGLPDLLFHVAKEEIDLLPDFMTKCSMAYVPQIGYLVAVDPWPGLEELRRGADDDEAMGRLDANLKFMFFVDGVPHFKSRKCIELDETFGDTASNICEHETEIMIQLSDIILRASKPMVDICHHVAYLDALIAMSLTSVRQNWKRPEVSARFGSLEIMEGRHPLQEMCVSTFVPNSTVMGDKVSGKDRVIVLTGPNACGKSIYLKQVGLIVFMAHLGCWVPVESAKVPLTDAIYTRIKTMESLDNGLSTFVADINQMTVAIRSATSDSLILVDEFGKGTSEVDGQALLAACLHHWLEMPSPPPFVLVSTHFQSLQTILPRDSPSLKFQTFAHERHGEDLIFLYRLINGVSVSSYANFVARKVGIPPDVVDRSNEVLEQITSGLPLTVPDLKTIQIEDYESICENFLALDLDSAEGIVRLFVLLHDDRLSSLGS